MNTRPRTAANRATTGTNRATDSQYLAINIKNLKQTAINVKTRSFESSRVLT